jgi:hypothetical protein
VDHVVGEVQCDFIQRKIRLLDLLGEHDVAVAIVARNRRFFSATSTACINLRVERAELPQPP